MSSERAVNAVAFHLRWTYRRTHGVTEEACIRFARLLLIVIRSDSEQPLSFYAKPVEIAKQSTQSIFVWPRIQYFGSRLCIYAIQLLGRNLSWY